MFFYKQYRKLARIEPFRKTNEETLEQSKLQHEIEITKDEKILEQLRLLTNAVNRIQTPSFSNQIQNQVKVLSDFGISDNFVAT